MNASAKIIVGPLSSAACLFRGFRMLGQPGLRRFLWGPLLINLCIYSLGVWVGAHYFSAALDWLIPGWLDWLRWLLWPLFALLLFVIAFFSFTVIANLIAAPFYSILAQKAQQRLGFALPKPEQEVSLGALAELSAAFQRLGYFALRALPLGVLSIIPGFNLISPFLWMLFGAWSVSLEYFAYPLEVQGILFAEQRELLKMRRLDALAFGGLVMLGLGIPVLNVLTPPAAVLGATIYFAERKEKSRVS